MTIRKQIGRAIRALTPELKIDSRSMRYLLQRHSVQSSADLIISQMPIAEPFETKKALYRYVMDRIPPVGLLLEFGVHNGDSINTLASMTEREIHGFDSFVGLPDDGIIPKKNDGGLKWYAGKLDRKGEMPEVRPNVRLYKGWFSDTLPAFYRENNGPAALLHIDSDIYSSAKFVLDASRDRIVEGTVILFDEYFNYEGWHRNEHRALSEFCAATGMQHEFIAYTYGCVACLRVTKAPSA